MRGNVNGYCQDVYYIRGEEPGNTVNNEIGVVTWVGLINVFTYT